MRTRYYWDKEQNKFVPEAEYRRPSESRSHYVIQDSCDPFLSHADGEFYDSKSEYRQMLKANNLVELGNDQIKPRPREDDRSLDRDLAQAMKDHWR